jgi:hypothetical protein
MTIMSYRFVPIEETDVRRYRVDQKDFYGNAGEVMQSDGAFPCRHCLTDLPEERTALLVAHLPFDRDAPFSEVGPIFVCPDECEPYSAIAEVPGIVQRRQVVIRAYDREDRIRYGHHDLVAGTEAEKVINRLLADPDTAYLHVRSAQTGCFLSRVERI